MKRRSFLLPILQTFFEKFLVNSENSWNGVSTTRCVNLGISGWDGEGMGRIDYLSSLISTHFVSNLFE